MIAIAIAHTIDSVTHITWHLNAVCNQFTPHKLLYWNDRKSQHFISSWNKVEIAQTVWINKRISENDVALWVGRLFRWLVCLFEMVWQILLVAKWEFAFIWQHFTCPQGNYFYTIICIYSYKSVKVFVCVCVLCGVTVASSSRGMHLSESLCLNGWFIAHLYNSSIAVIANVNS